MIATEMKTNNGKRLVAVAAILALVMCVAAVAIPSTNAADDESTKISAEDFINMADNGVIVVDKDYNITGAVTLYDMELDLAGFTVTVDSTITAVNSDIKSSEADGTISKSATGPLVNLQGVSSIDNVTLQYTGTDDTAILDVSAGADASITGCTFTGEKSTTAVYANYADTVETSVSIQDSQISGEDTQLKEIIWDGVGNGNMDISNSTGVRLNFTYANAGENTSTITIGEQITITDTAIDRINVDANNEIIVPENESLSTGSIQGQGKLTVNEGGYFEGVVPDGFKVDNQNKRIGLDGNMINFGVDDLPISGNIYVIENLTINEGKTLTIQSGAVLDLNGKTLNIEGALVVETGAKVINSASTGSIILSQDGVLDNNGTIGTGSVAAQVGASTSSFVKMLNVSGISFTVDAEDEDNPVLQVSGEIYADDSGINHELTLNNVEVINTMTIGDNVEAIVTKNVDIIDGATLTIDGAVTIGSEDKLVMTAGSTVNVNGEVDGVITAETGKYQNVVGGVAASGPTGTTTVNFHNGTDYVTGVTLTVQTAGTTEVVDGERTAFTEQSLYISGDADLIAVDEDAEKLSGEIVITNSVAAEPVQAGVSYVPAGATLSLAKGISMDADGTTVLGTVQYPYASGTDVIGFVGTEYSVGTSSERTVYITDFATAYGHIAEAYDGLKVYGDLEIAIDIDLQNKQKISFETSGANIVIDEDSEVTVNAGASIGKVTTVDGILTKYNGATCPVPTNYAVLKNGDGYVQYAGLAAALANAVAGETIEVVKDCAVDGNLAVTDGVTLSVKNGVTVQISGNLNVPETSKVTNNGAIQMTGKTSKITVAGELDSSKGTVNYGSIAEGEFTADVNTNAQKALTSSGKTTVQTGADNSLINASGAIYASGSNTILTTLSKAAGAVVDAKANSIEIVGSVTDRNDVTLPEGITLEFANNSKAVLGNITLSKDASVDMKGTSVEVTATVTANVGAEGSEVASSIETTKASGITVGIVPYISADNTTTTYLVIDGTQVGAVTVSAGNVYVDEYTVDGCTLTVASGTTLGVEAIGNSVVGTITVGENKDKAALVVDGTFSVNGGTIEPVTKPAGEGADAETEIVQIIDVNGTMTVSEIDVTISGTINVDGTVDVQSTEDAPAKIAIAGSMYVNGTVSGPVDTSTGYLVAYAGSDVSAAEIDVSGGESSAVSTQFYINGDLYMTAYTSGSIELQTILTDEDFSMSGYVTKDKEVDINTIGSWFVDAEMSEPATSGNIGNPEALYFKASPAMVDVTISVGEGISLYIDGVRYQTGTQLSVGTHTVSANVNPGYKGDVTIQFNGQTVTGSFTITPEMASNAYEGTVSVSASGNITVDSSAVVVGGDSDGMSLTDILLIVLVVLILVMAIIVALRLMRS